MPGQSLLCLSLLRISHVSLSTSPVSAVTVPPSFALIDSPVSPVSLFSLRPPSPNRFQPGFEEPCEVQCASSPFATITDVSLSPISLALTGSSSSPASEWSDGSFYSAVDSLENRTPAMDPAPVLALS